MKSQKKVYRILAMLVVAGLMAGSALAASTVTRRTIEVEYANIKLVVDGAEVTPKDAAGNVVEPFINNGTTYLPVRAMGEALGKEVKWDGNTKTIYIGQTAHLPYQVNEAELYDGTKPNTSFSVAGKTYERGVVLHSFRSAPEDGRTNIEFDGSAVWNTEGFQTMTFTVGHVGEFQRNATLYVALDGIASGEYQLRWDGTPQTITVNLGGSGNVKLTLVADPYHEYLYQSDAHNKGESYGIFDVNLA